MLAMPRSIRSTKGFYRSIHRSAIGADFHSIRSKPRFFLVRNDYATLIFRPCSYEIELRILIRSNRKSVVLDGLPEGVIVVLATLHNQVI